MKISKFTTFYSFIMCFLTPDRALRAARSEKIRCNRKTIPGSAQLI